MTSSMGGHEDGGHRRGCCDTARSCHCMSEEEDTERCDIIMAGEKDMAGNKILRPPM